MEEVKNLVELNTEVKVQGNPIVIIGQENCFNTHILTNSLPMYVETSEYDKPILVLNVDSNDVNKDKVLKYFGIEKIPSVLGFKEGKLEVKKEGFGITPDVLDEILKL